MNSVAAILVVTSLWLVTSVTAASAQCERAPVHAQPADAHYRLGLAGEPDLFLPGELYTVTLQGIDSGQGPTPFIGFTIWVEVRTDPAPKTEKVEEQPVEVENKSLGTFQAYDAQAKISVNCSPAVENATAHPKTEVQVIWNAPPDLKDTCVRICGKAGPIPLTGGGGSSSGWSVLVRELCAAPAAPPNFAKLPPIVEPCCACDEAKYEVTFEGLWSRNTHPREFPPESARAHFGDVIGASHTAQFRVWQEGRVASPGMKRLADDGTTTALEKELKSESEHIRTIIKARGISWQQISGGGIPNTFAVFRADAKHHLISLASKLAPSPDWIVGVSALELCNANCTWSRSATIPLYPYDAGTDNGLTYMSRRSPTTPPSPVRALRPDWPRDVRSPFFNADEEMRPFARLRMTRLRLYERSCDAAGNIHDGEGIDRVQDTVGTGSTSGGGACATHAWSAWGPCSVTCGLGRTIRQRNYVWPSRAYAEACRVPLTDYKTCHGPRMHCRAPSEYEPDPAESTGPCAVSAWSEWSPCEGCGIRARTRHYVGERAFKRCHIGYRARTVLSQAIPCDMGPCERPPGNRTLNSTNFDWFFVDVPTGDCRVTNWSTWSPCSAKCGRGRRLRTRLYVAQDPKVQKEVTRRLFSQWNRRFAQFQSIEYPPENLTLDDPALETAVQELMDKCQTTLSQQEALCDGDDVSCINKTLPAEVCALPMSVGHCRSYEERWFYEWARGACEPFGFSGCGGNANNFRTRDHCLRACRTFVNATQQNETKPPAELNAKKLKPTPTPSHSNNEVIQNDIPALYEANCEVGPWLGWSECSGDCELAIKLNYRLILSTTAGEGKGCRRLIKTRRCRPAACRKLNTTDVVEQLNYYDD